MANQYGTTSEMIIQTIEDGDISRLLAIDANGLYFTSQDRVDRGVADVNRYGTSREFVKQRLEEMGMDPHELFMANQHLIRTEEEASPKQKLNPIKASKRR